MAVGCNARLDVCCACVWSEGHGYSSVATEDALKHSWAKGNGPCFVQASQDPQYNMSNRSKSSSIVARASLFAAAAANADCRHLLLPLQVV